MVLRHARSSSSVTFVSMLRCMIVAFAHHVILFYYFHILRVSRNKVATAGNVHWRSNLSLLHQSPFIFSFFFFYSFLLLLLLHLLLFVVLQFRFFVVSRSFRFRAGCAVIIFMPSFEILRDFWQRHLEAERINNSNEVKRTWTDMEEAEGKCRRGQWPSIGLSMMMMKRE